jgi:hypothetical protein
MASSSSRRVILGRLRLSVLGETRRRFVTVTVMMPEHDKPIGWTCEVRVSGAGLRLKRKTAGGDALHAIQLAFEFATQALDGSGLQLSWGKDDGQWAHPPVGWTGFQRTVPFILGPDGPERNERISRFINDELRSVARADLERHIAYYKRRGEDLPAHVQALIRKVDEPENPL